MRVLFFGCLGEAIGREIDLPAGPEATIGEVRRRLIALYPGAAPILARPAVRACLDDEMVEDDRVVPPGAELAFFPPLSGG